MSTLLFNHLWQSSLCVGAAGLIALALDRNSANIRFWLWFAASMKFLVPFAALTALSAYLLAPIVRPVAVPTVAFMEPLATPFSAASVIPAAALGAEAPALTSLPAQAVLPERASPPVTRFPFHFDLGFALLALWAVGFLILAGRWLTRWLEMRTLLREAIEVQVDIPVAVKFSATRLEPGLAGILNPVILLPQGIEQELSPPELQAVLAHELCHWRRHDNLLAAIHMLVEALFWFFPLVWWLGARLNAERERACDESVLADGNDPKLYAEGILKVCRAYLQSPLPCVAGVSGAGLKKRIEAIMENRLVLQLNVARKFVLSASAAAAFALPLALGLIMAPVSQIAAKAAPMPLSTKDPSNSTEQAPPFARDISSALQANQTTGNTGATTGALQPQETNASGDHALPSSHPIRPSLTETMPAPLLDVTGLLSKDGLPTPQLTAVNDPTPAAAAPAPNGAQAPATRIAAAETCTLPSIADTATLEAVPGTDLMTVPVTINGASKHFLLDIGTDPTEVSQATVTQLGLPERQKQGETIGAGGTNMSGLTSVGNPNLSALTNGGLGNVSVYDVRDKQGSGALNNPVRISSFAIGGAKSSSMVFLVANDAQMGSPSEPYDGLLTGDFFKQYDVELDFRGKQINWLTPTKCTDPEQVVFWSHSVVAAIPMTIQGGKIQVPVMVAGHQINAVIDTSSSRTMMRRDIAELILGLKPDSPDMKPEGNLTDGKGQPVYVHTFSEISFTGGVTANNVPALILTNSLIHQINSEMILGSWARSADATIPDLALGMDVLHQLHMYVVPGQGKIYVTSAQ